MKTLASQVGQHAPILVLWVALNLIHLNDRVAEVSQEIPGVKRVNGAGEVNKELLLTRPPVKVHKLLGEVSDSILKIFPAIVLGKYLAEGSAPDLLGKVVNLVQQEDNRGVHEPLAVAHVLEQMQALQDAVLNERKRTENS